MVLVQLLKPSGCQAAVIVVLCATDSCTGSSFEEVEGWKGNVGQVANR